MDARAIATNRELMRAQIRAHRGFGIAGRPRKRIPKPLHPDIIAADYLRQIVDMANRPMRAELQAVLFPHLGELLASAAHERGDSARFDAGVSATASKLIDIAARRMQDKLTPRIIQAAAENFGQRTSVHQKEQLNKQIRAALGINVVRAEPRIAPIIDQFATKNVALIESIPTDYYKGVKRAVLDAMQKGDRAEDLADKLEKRYEVADWEATRIARDQIGKLNGQLNMIRQTALGVIAYFWRGMQDNRERDEHVEREGERFEWSDPPDDGNPGEPILCRCFGEPDFSPILEGL